MVNGAHHVGNGQEDKDEDLQLVGEQSFEMLEAVGSVVENALEGLHGSERLTRDFRMVGRQGRSFINGGKVGNSQNGWRSPVELCNLVQDFDGVGLSSSADEELGRLAEGEDEVAQEEDDQGGASENDEGVSPAHVAIGSAARSLASVAGGQIGITTPFWSCGGAVCDGRGNDDTNGLP